MRGRDGSGRRFRVNRRWMPWRSRTARWLGKTADTGFNTPSNDPVSTTIGLILLIPFLLILPLWLVELAAQIVCFPVALLLRATGALPWWVEVWRFLTLEHAEPAGSFGESGHRCQAIADHLSRTGGPMPPRRPGPAPQPPPIDGVPPSQWLPR